MYNICDFETKHVEEARQIALTNYNTERELVTALPAVTAIPHLEWFAENDKGVCAFENGKMLGYLCAWGPFDNVFACNPNTKGVWSPAHGNAAAGENKTRVYREMYQAIAKKWVDNEALIHAITLYAHDEAAINAFFTYGFGLRCIDAVKPIEPRGIEYPDNILLEELPREDARRITPLNNELIKHLGQTPSFMTFSERTSEAVQTEAVEDGIRYFVAKKRDEIIAYLKISDDGEHFACDAPDMMSVCGAYLLPEHRGRGIFDALLSYTENILAGEGYKRLGVDCESFNATAYGFWLKHFTAYTYSVVRRIDERI